MNATMTTSESQIRTEIQSLRDFRRNLRSEAIRTVDTVSRNYRLQGIATATRQIARLEAMIKD